MIAKLQICRCHTRITQHWFSLLPAVPSRRTSPAACFPSPPGCSQPGLPVFCLLGDVCALSHAGPRISKSHWSIFCLLRPGAFSTGRSVISFSLPEFVTPYNLVTLANFIKVFLPYGSLVKIEWATPKLTSPAPPRAPPCVSFSLDFMGLLCFLISIPSDHVIHWLKKTDSKVSPQSALSGDHT